MIIEIGNKPLREISADELKQIVIIEGCCPVIEHNGEKIWNEPVITDFNNTMFSDTLVLDYNSYRKTDNLKSSDYVLFFNFKDFRCHYTKDHQPGNGKRIGLETIKYLIKNGYDVPIY